MGYHASIDFALVIPADAAVLTDPTPLLAHHDIGHLVEDGFDGNHANLFANVLDVQAENDDLSTSGDKLVTLSYRGAVTGWNEDDLDELANVGVVGIALAIGEDNQSFGWLLSRVPATGRCQVLPWGSFTGPGCLHVTTSEAQLLRDALADTTGSDARNLRRQLATAA